MSLRLSIFVCLLATGMASGFYVPPEAYKKEHEFPICPTAEEVGNILNTEDSNPVMLRVQIDFSWSSHSVPEGVTNPLLTLEDARFLITSANIENTVNFDYSENQVGFLYLSKTYLSSVVTDVYEARLEGLNNVTISNNTSHTKATASSGGPLGTVGVLAAGDCSRLSISQNSGAINISSNSVSANDKVYGGAVYLFSTSQQASSQLELHENAGDVYFRNNSVTSSGSTSSYQAQGGAIFADYQYSTISIVDNQGNLTFAGNQATGYGNTNAMGGAIYGGKYIKIDNNSGAITFDGNKAVAINAGTSKLSGQTYGGAIYSTSAEASISHNGGGVAFTNNYAETVSGKAESGAVSMSSGSLLLDNNTGYVIITGNHAASSSAAAAYSHYSIVSAQAGAMNVKTLTISNTQAGANPSVGVGNVTISDNYVSGKACTVQGGALVTDTLTITGNQGVSIRNNYASNTPDAGAIASKDGTYCVYGGAIYSKKGVTMTNNAGAVTITGNHVDAASGANADYVSGGAIYGTNSPLVVEGNGNVELSGNYIRIGDSVSFNAISLKPTTKSTDAAPIMKLAAGEGKNITFRDSVLLVPSNAKNTQHVSLNADYTDQNGASCKATGDIVFTGKDAAGNDMAQRITNLKTELKLADQTASENEVNTSLTSRLDADVTLHAGTLRVEDGAILQMQKLRILTGSSVKIKNGEVLVDGISLRSTSAPARISGVLIESGSISGNGAGATMADVYIEAVNEAFSISDIAMSNVHFEAPLTTLNLTNVSFDNASYFSVGETGTIILDKAVVHYSLEHLTPGQGVFTADLSDLFHCATQGQLELDIDTQKLVQNGYTGLAVQFGEDVQTETLSIEIDGVTYEYTGETDPSGAPSFQVSIVPEPGTTTLSLLALTGLLTRRRRK